MRIFFVLSVIVFFVLGCEQNIPTSSNVEPGEGIEILSVEDAEKMVSGTETKKVVTSSPMEIKAEISEAVQAEKTQAIEVYSSEGEKEIKPAALEVVKDTVEQAQEDLLKEDEAGQEIISEGRWFFAVYNPKSGKISYYDKNRGFLGKRDKK